MRKINRIFLHTSDSPDDMDVGAKEIRRWHLEKGWKDIGYHYVIRRGGQVEKGRPDSQSGAHVRGHNKNSIGVVWVGRDFMTNEQREAMYDLLSNLLFKYYLSPENVLGHYEVNEYKNCPNLYMPEVREELTRRITLEILPDEE